MKTITLCCKHVVKIIMFRIMTKEMDQSSLFNKHNTSPLGILTLCFYNSFLSFICFVCCTC